MEMSWNPRWDFQATKRIHRFGQKRACTVLKLESTSGIEDQQTLDQKIVDKQRSKIKAMEDLLQGAQKEGDTVIDGEITANDLQQVMDLTIG